MRRERVDRYKDILTVNDFENFFKILKISIVSNSNFQNDLIQYEGRYNDIKKKRSFDTISNEKSTRELNKLRSDIVVFLDDLKEEDFVDSIVSSQIDIDEINKISLAEDQKFLNSLKRHGLRRKLASEDGIKIYKEYFDQFIELLINSAKEYAEIANAKLNVKQPEDKFVILSIDNIYLKVFSCIDINKRLLWISIEPKDNDKVKPTFDMFKLDYTLDQTLIWQCDRKIDLYLTSKELVSLTLKKAFTIIMESSKP